MVYSVFHLYHFFCREALCKLYNMLVPVLKGGYNTTHNDEKTTRDLKTNLHRKRKNHVNKRDARQEK